MNSRVSIHYNSPKFLLSNLLRILPIILALGWGLAPTSLDAKEKGDKSSKAVVLPTHLDEQSINAFLAGLTDEQTRQVLKQQLEKSVREDRQSKDETSGFTQIVGTMERTTSEIRQRLLDLKSGSYSGPRLLSQSISQMQPAAGDGSRILLTLLTLLGLSLGAAGLEWLFRRYTVKLREPPARAQLTSWTGKVKNLLLLGILDLIAIFVFALGLLGLFVLFLESGTNTQYRRLVLLSFLAVVLIVRAVILVLNFLFAPRCPELRLPPLQNESARSIVTWLAGFAALIGTSLLLRTILELNQADAMILLAQRALSGLVFLMLLFILAYNKRPVITHMIKKLSRQCDGEPSMLAQIADHWHLLAIPYAAALYGVWLIFILIGETELVQAILALLLSGPVFILLNTLAQHALDTLACTVAAPRETKHSEAALKAPDHLELDDIAPNEKTDSSTTDSATDRSSAQPVAGTESKNWSIERVFPILRPVISMIIAAAVGVGVLSFWEVRFTLGAAVVKASIQILVAVILTYGVWRLINRYINDRLEKVGGLKRDDDEEMGEGGSRVGTLLILLRKFLFIVLTSIMILIVLSATGIDIAPLLAGAGVVGLAIGFGSQSLVKDIVSGVFFLVDDAFRIGDYIVAGSVKGTVEHISIRSIQLRHHRGMVITVPFSDLKGVTNFSRDYIIDKLDFGVPFDTDLEKVRKIIKRMNKDLLKDEEYGPKLLDPIKSQGVRQIDDAAMTLRIKLKTRPGDQFIIRREVYKRLQNAFKEAGIEFARRQVIVRMPDDLTEATVGEGAPGKSSSKTLSAGGAAGAAIQIAVEEELARQEAEKQAPKK